MINVLVVVGGLDRGGVETLFSEIYKFINKKEFQFYFLCYENKKYEYEEEIEKNGGVVLKINKPNYLKLSEFVKDIKDIVKKYDIDIVHCNTYYNSSIVMYAAKKAKVKIRITHSHNASDNRRQTLLRKIYAGISKCGIKLFSTHYAACGIDAGKALFGNKSKFKVIRNGIELDKFKFNKEYRIKCRKELNIDEDTVLIGNVGRITEQKNPIFTVKTFYEYNKINNNSKLLMIGTGDLECKVKEMCKELKIEDKVLLLGSRSDVYALYSAMDIFLFPSLYEGLPITLVESQAVGLPSLVSDTVTKEVVYTELPEFFSLRENEKEWGKKLSNIVLNINREECVQKNPYDIKETTKDLEKWYKEILKRND